MLFRIGLITPREESCLGSDSHLLPNIQLKKGLTFQFSEINDLFYTLKQNRATYTNIYYGCQVRILSYTIFENGEISG